MLTLVLPLLFQAVSGEPQAAQGSSTQPAAESAAKPAEPNVVCTMEPITGTRARKMRVCKTKGYEKNGERARDTMEMQQRMGGPNATLPPGVAG